MIRTLRSLRALVVLLLVVAVLAPVAVMAAGGTFTDDDTSIFEADIEWMADNGITLGCNPPTNDNYCPTDPVTRGQMAAFMHRLGVNGVVDAADSALLDGKGPGYYENAVFANDQTFALVPGVFDGGNQALAEIPAAVPSAGYLLISVTASLYDPDSQEQVFFWLQVDDSVCKNSSPSADSVAFGYATTPGANDRQSVSLTGVAAVDGGDHTVTFCGRGPLGNTQLYEPSLTALFTGQGTITTTP